MIMSAEAFHQLVRERRSVRGFVLNLPEATLQSIFETARWALLAQTSNPGGFMLHRERPVIGYESSS